LLTRFLPRRILSCNETTMERTPETLRRIPLFADLSDGALARNACVARARAFAPGKISIFEGEPWQAAYFVAES